MRSGIEGPVRQIDALQRVGCSRPLQAVRCKPAGPIPGAQHITHLTFTDAKRQQALRRDRIAHLLVCHDGRRPTEITAIGHLSIHEDRNGMTVLALHLVPRRPPVAQVGRIAQRRFQILLVQRMMVRHPATEQCLGFLHQRPVLGRHARRACITRSFRRTGSTLAITRMRGVSPHACTPGIPCPVTPSSIHSTLSGNRRHHGAAIGACQGLAGGTPFQVPPTFRAGPAVGRAHRGCRLRCLSHAGTRPGPNGQCDRPCRCVAPSAHPTGCWPAHPPPTRSAAAQPARA